MATKIGAKTVKTKLRPHTEGDKASNRYIAAQIPKHPGMVARPDLPAGPQNRQ